MSDWLLSVSLPWRDFVATAGTVNDALAIFFLQSWHDRGKAPAKPVWASLQVGV